MEHSEGVPSKAERVGFTLEVTAFQRHPCERLIAAIAQVWPPVLPSRLGILFAHGVDGVRVQSEFLSTSGGQDVEVKTTRPTLIPFERVLLGIVAVVPNVLDRAALPVQQPIERLHAIAVNENHWTIIQA